MKSSTLCANDEWRATYRAANPGVGRSRGTAHTGAWSNTRDAGELLGVTARLHPQLRRCINALDLPAAEPVGIDLGWDEIESWLRGARRLEVPDGLIIRRSVGDQIPLWGDLMRSKRLRLRLAVISWSQGLALDAVEDKAFDYWEDFLGVEQARERAVRSGKPRDVKEKLADELRALSRAASRARPHANPRSGLPGYGPHEWSSFWTQKYRDIPELFADDGIQKTALPRELLSQGWHLVAPLDALGWMIAQTVLGRTKGRASALGRAHLGLSDGFRAADRARFFGRLSRLNRPSSELATLTIQRLILDGLAALGVVPETISDAGLPVQTLLIGEHDEGDCCVVISGEHLRIWRRSGPTPGLSWSSEPAFQARLPDDFTMAVLAEDAVALRGKPEQDRPFSFTIARLQLHTFPRNPEAFPADAWSARTRLRPESYVPFVSRRVADWT